MHQSRHFRFDDVDYVRTVAHGGAGEILTRRVLDSGVDSACNFIDITIVPVGCTIGTHMHPADNEEIYIVISGDGEMHLDGETFAVAAGHVIVNRPSGTHGLRNTGERDLRLVVIEVPVRGDGAV